MKHGSSAQQSVQVSTELFIKGTFIVFMDLIIHITLDSSVHLQVLYHTYKVLMEMSGDSSTLVIVKGSTV